MYLFVKIIMNNEFSLILSYLLAITWTFFQTSKQENKVHALKMLGVLQF